MTTLIVKDLPVSEELSSKDMVAVRGGMGKTQALYNCEPYPYPDATKNMYSFDATQALAQCQDTVVNNGNNVAFSSGINATVNPSQKGSNNISIGGY